MLNKKVKKLSIRQIEKLAVKNASFKNMPTTWKTLNQLNVNTHKSFMSDILPLELSIGKNLDLIEEAIINKKNRNKSKHDLLSKTVMVGIQQTKKGNLNLIMKLLIVIIMIVLGSI